MVCVISVTGNPGDRLSPPFDPRPLGADAVWRADQWRAKLTRFEAGGFEISVRVVDRQKVLDTFEAFGGFGPPIKPREPGAEVDPENILRARRRAKTKVRHLAKNMGVTHLLTLSTRQRVNSREELLQAWARFLRLYARARGERLTFIQVIERHPTNREHLHLHAAVTSFLPVGLLRRLWYIALGGTGAERGSATPGGVNMQQIKAKNPGRRAARIARYIAKYMTKDTAEEFNKKRYSASRGFAPETLSWWMSAEYTGPESYGAMLAEVLRILPLSFAREDHYVFPDGRGGWFQVVQGDEGPHVCGADPPF